LGQVHQYQKYFTTIGMVLLKRLGIQYPLGGYSDDVFKHQ